MNFASYDYLGLSTHTEVRAAAIEAINQCGTQIAGAPVLQGNSALSLRLQAALAELVGLHTLSCSPPVGGGVWRHHGVDPHQGPRRS